MRLINDARWPSKTYPIEYLGEDGQRRSSWPHLFPIAWIDQQRRTYERLGELMVWNREYLCQAVSDTDRTFKKEMIRVSPRERRWEPVYAMIDPARSVRQTSAATGWAAWSWINNRLIVWASGAPMLLPDEIVALAFDLAERFDPVWIGIEQDGLSQFLMQPLRQAQLRRGVTIPYRGISAISGTKGRGKIEFIRGLQPFFDAGEVSFAQPLPELEAQLLNFPTGRIDGPNALAYALLMRPALPIYDGFTADHIVETIEPVPDRALYLAANASGAMTTAALVQVADGRIGIAKDWVLEGSPVDRVEEISAEALLFCDAHRIVRVPMPRAREWAEMLKTVVPDSFITRKVAPIWVAPLPHSDRHNNFGLIQAVKAVPAEIRTGGDAVAGQIHLRDMLSSNVRGLPAVEVSQDARWTLRALSGGYTRAMVRGRLQDYAEEGPYRLLMEGIESFLGMMRVFAARDEEEDDEPPNYAYDREGRRYLSAMPARERG
jgi:hypothetical protein